MYRKKNTKYLRYLRIWNQFRREFTWRKIIGWCLILGVIGSFLGWFFLLRGMPSLDALAAGEYFRESTVIYDKDKQPIYTIFKDGKRTYIPYEDISEDIKNAIVSTEDKSFFTNPGFDLRGLVRAGVNYIIGATEEVKGTSTISQQLIKNTLLTNERSLRRKVQEWWLSYSMNREYSKEKILEMYLNAISFGYNASGIEEASKTYFGKSAKEVGPLGATILASLPKWPTYYSPYLHRDRLMGVAYGYPESDTTAKYTIDVAEDRKVVEPLYTIFRSYLTGMTLTRTDDGLTICGIEERYVRSRDFRPNRDGCSELNFDQVLGFFADIKITGNITLPEETSPTAFWFEYNIGRKDFVATRMLEDGKIDGPTFQKILVDGLEFQFRRYSEAIKYPHFVMYVKEYLETKYQKDIDITSGLKVYTTLDPKLQDKAEELVKKQVEINKKQYGANSAALVSMENTSGKLLAMVGGPDYFDVENGGNNNMAIARRQPGSSFKPFVYALALSKNPISPESPIADVETKFWKWIPDNYDQKFNGIMTVKNALAYSRNIPAAKMFFLAGGEEELVTFWQNIGLSTLKNNADYGAPLAIGTAEVRPIDLLQAYSVLANEGKKQDIYMIDRIEDSNGNVIEEHTPAEAKSVFSDAASYLISQILSDPTNRPESPFWRNALTIPGRTVAAKTGTSNKDVSKNGKKSILPRDLWTAGYSPQITTVVWAGNIDGKETRGNCDGLNCAAPIWKGFMEFAHKNLPKEDFQKPESIKTYVIAKASGKLATEETPKEQKITALFATKLSEFDDGLREEKYDTLCNGPLSENTPQEAIGIRYIPSAKPVIDGFNPEWTRWFFEAAWKKTGTGELVPTTEPCERPGGPGNISITIENVGINKEPQNTGKKIIEFTWIGDRPIIRTKLSLIGSNEVITSMISSGGTLNGTNRGTFQLKDGEHTIEVELVDRFGFSYRESKTLKIGSSALTTITTGVDPTITMINPKPSDTGLSLYAGDKFNLRFSVQSATEAREITVTIDDKLIQSATAGDVFMFPVGSEWLTAGEHTVRIKLIDGNLKSQEKSFSLTILPR